MQNATRVRLNELRRYVGNLSSVHQSICREDLERYDQNSVDDLDVAWIYAIVMHLRKTVVLLTHATTTVYVHVPDAYDQTANAMLNCVMSATASDDVIYLLQHSGHFYAVRPTEEGGGGGQMTLLQFLSIAREAKLPNPMYFPVDARGDAAIVAPDASSAAPPEAAANRCCVEREQIQRMREAMQRLEETFSRCGAA